MTSTPKNEKQKIVLIFQFASGASQLSFRNDTSHESTKFVEVLSKKGQSEPTAVDYRQDTSAQKDQDLEASQAFIQGAAIRELLSRQRTRLNQWKVTLRLKEQLHRTIKQVDESRLQ